LTGTLSSEFRAWRNVTYFRAASNFISGPLPAEYASWTAVKAFEVYDNQMNGTLPDEYSALTALYRFDLSRNHFSGTLPSSWGNLTSIISFYVANNALTGTLPPSYANWGSSIARLSVTSNDLSGTLPLLWGQSMTQLASLSLANNSFYGDLPRPSFLSLQILVISHNNFTGVLPTSSTWPLLFGLNAQNNTHLFGPVVFPFLAVVSSCATMLCSSGQAPLASSCCLPDDVSSANIEDPMMVYQIALQYPIAFQVCGATSAPDHSTTTPVVNSSDNTSSINRINIAAAVKTTSTAVLYATLIAGGASVGRGAVPSLQRATSVLSLAALCRAAATTNMTHSADQSDDNDDQFANLADNPLSASLPLRSEVLNAAAGAAVVNLALVGLIGIALHICALIQKHMQTANKGPQIIQSIVCGLPSSLLPGACAVAYGTLVQPSIGACMTLLLSEQRDARSIACGVAMLCLWTVFPVYCAMEVLWRGRRDSGSFSLRSVAVLPAAKCRRPPNQLSTDVVAATPLASFRAYVTAPTEHWVPRRVLRGRAAAHATFLLEKMEADFGAYVRQREWFFMVEWTLSALSGSVLGAALSVAVTVDRDPCAAMRWAAACAVAFGVVHVTLTTWLRPNSVRLEFWTAASLDVLAIVSEVLVLANADSASGIVLIISSSIELGVIALLMVNSALSLGHPRSGAAAAAAAATKEDAKAIMLSVRSRNLATNVKGVASGRSAIDFVR
jgi:hypothetical protein